MAKPEHMKKWWATRKANLVKRSAEKASISYRGDNFRFVAWGGVDALKLWSKRP